MAFSNMAFYYYYGAFKKPGMYCMCFTYKIECQQNEQIHQFKKKIQLIQITKNTKAYDKTANSAVAWGPSINYVGMRGGGGLAKCPCYYISLCSKLAYGGV